MKTWLKYEIIEENEFDKGYILDRDVVRILHNFVPKEGCLSCSGNVIISYPNSASYRYGETNQVLFKCECCDFSWIFIYYNKQKILPNEYIFYTGGIYGPLCSVEIL